MLFMTSQYTYKPEDLIGKIFYVKSKNTYESFPILLFLDVLTTNEEYIIFNTYEFENKQIAKARYESNILPALYKALNKTSFQDVECVQQYQWIIL